jgi:hypothetical protein
VPVEAVCKVPPLSMVTLPPEVKVRAVASSYCSTPPLFTVTE